MISFQCVLPALASVLFAARAGGLNFTVAGGQIFTPGLAIVDAPQPGTPLGGDMIEIPLDISGNGRLRLPPHTDDTPTGFNNITIFLYSYDTGHNFTITNGTASSGNASLGDILLQEPGSTVKHVRWTWPDCLVGDGQPNTADSARGIYNISIRQNFRLNGAPHYTIFDMPISVTNGIGNGIARPRCEALDNPLLRPEMVNAEAANAGVPILFAPGDATVIDTGARGSGEGLGGSRPEATPGDGLGGARSLGEGARRAAWRACLLGLIWIMVI